MKGVFIIWLLLNFCYSCTSQEYYGINNFGKLELIDTNKFYFDYFDVGNDTGRYTMIKDTIFLTSSVLPVKYYQNKTIFTSNASLLDINVKIFAKNGFILKEGKFIPQYGNLLIDTILKIDTASRIYVNNLILHEGQLISFEFFGTYKYVVPKDTVFKGYFELDTTFGRRVYFENYPLLMRDGYLLPFDEEANEYFRKINGFEFLPMKKGKKNQKYKTYLSGFGEIH